MKWLLAIVSLGCAQVLSYDDYRARVDATAPDVSVPVDTSVVDTFVPDTFDSGPPPFRIPSRPTGVAMASGTGKTIWLGVKKYYLGTIDPTGGPSEHAWKVRGYDLDGMDPAGPQFIHLQVECAKLAFADREAFYGDPDFVKVPIETLLSEKYNAERRKLISNKASMDLRPGSLPGFGGNVRIRREEGPRAAVGSLGAGEPTVGRVGEVIGDTVHFDIIDQAGNMVSSTPSGGWPVNPAGNSAASSPIN